ncbi:hypothetical protein BO71DRAFT_401577 [Aspergillus ellipticus CBS 707.79]|uniref:Uncharacterized protein n=1 Tax=Aspergillus ellipticus CBS 707.79 TaxID=1448320 RepID=A0A319D2W0_9EURO|nr:hypothetical protein BO71DRAFT_403555 [Aspergillus ellipticus CBS 707.79]PYH91244.1 hypothetical protein BO71DRAFT_401577 [Aspergillus ellipticus CBS 707.79]
MHHRTLTEPSQQAQPPLDTKSGLAPQKQKNAHFREPSTLQVHGALRQHNPAC